MCSMLILPPFLFHCIPEIPGPEIPEGPCTHEELLPHEMDVEAQACPVSHWQGLLNAVIIPEREKAYWNVYYDQVCDFIRKHTSGSLSSLRIIEIGTAYGGNMVSLASAFPGATLLAVDPLLPGYDAQDAHSNALSTWAADHNLTHEEWSVAWGMGLIHDIRSRHGCQYHLLKGDSLTVGNALLRRQVQQFNVAFIDGLHTYAGVKADIQLYSRLVKPGGLMIFNDYGGELFPGVTTAVDEFASAIKARVIVGNEHTAPGISNAGILMPAY